MKNYISNKNESAKMFENELLEFFYTRSSGNSSRNIHSGYNLFLLHRIHTTPYTGFVLFYYFFIRIIYMVFYGVCVAPVCFSYQPNFRNKKIYLFHDPWGASRLSERRYKAGHGSRCKHSTFGRFLLSV